MNKIEGSWPWGCGFRLAPVGVVIAALLFLLRKK